jgi:hypothetical protein
MFEPVNMAYNMREFGFRDNNGYALILGQDITQETQEG